MKMFSNLIGNITGKETSQTTSTSNNSSDLQFYKDKCHKLEEENKTVKQMLLSDTEDVYNYYILYKSF